MNEPAYAVFRQPIGKPGVGRTRTAAAAVACLLVAWCAADAAASDDELRALVEENRILKEQLRAQQQQLDELGVRLGRLLQASDRRDAEIVDLRKHLDAAPRTPAAAPEPEIASAPRENAGSRVHLSGEAGLVFFSGGSESAYPNDEFRVDDAKVFLEAELHRDVYLVSELDLAVREASDENFHLGECYVEFAGLPAPWDARSPLTLRFGRLNIPFGEEYQVRNPIDNPLVTHSLADPWGIDEGVEVFGQSGKLSYVLAVQNGGHKALHDYDSDKAIVARLGLDPARGLHVSASAMRTGRLTRAGDAMSELWIGNGFFRALGSAATTTTFAARLAQLDAAVRWRGGHLSGALGRAWFDDDSTAADNRRVLDFGHIEGVQALTGKFYGAARYSRINTDKGYPLVGLGGFGDYFFTDPPTMHLWRLGLGLGYRFNPSLLFKCEYTFEDGALINGEERDRENLLSAEVGVKF